MHRISCLVFVITACSRPQTTDQVVSDSLATTNVVTDSLGTSPNSPTPETIVNYAELITAARDSVENRRDDYFQVSISTQQYESASDVVWYFDKRFAPLYFKDDWSMEGTEGTSEFFIRNNVPVCVFEYQSNGSRKEETSWCKETGGERIIYGSTENDDTTERLPEDYAAKIAQSFELAKTALTGLLKSAEREGDDSDVLRLKIENQADEGAEYSETVTIEIPKALYEAMVD